MTKSTHSTTRRRSATGGTVETPAAPLNFIDPTTLPAEYAMRVRGDCLAPAINGGDSVLVDQRQPYAAGDLVCVFLKPECVAPGSTNVGLKRIVMNMMPGVTYPYQASPDSNIMPVLVCEQDNPPLQYTIPADQILAIHRCMGRVPDDVVLYDDKTGEPEYRRAASAGWSRRELLAGAITVLPAGALATLPALAVEADHPDADLFALGREYDVIYAKMKDAERRIDLVAPPRPDPVEPEALRVRPGDEALGMPRPSDCNGGVPDTYGWREVDRLRGQRQVRPYRGPIKLEHVAYATVAELVNAAISYSTARDEPWPEAQARADEIVSAHDAYMAEWKSPDDASEAVAEIEKEIEGYYDEVHPVAEAIVATRAVTLDGLIVKARAVRWIYRDEPEQFEAEANGTDDELLRSITADLWAMQKQPPA